MPEHYLRLSGACTLATDAYQWVGLDIDALVQHSAMGIVHGQAGLGKTFAVQAAVERLTKTGTASISPPDAAAAPTPFLRPPLRVVQVVFPHHPHTLRVAQEVAQSLIGSIPKGVNRFTIQEQVLEQLSGAPHLMVVDEAQRLTRHAMEVLRYLYDDTTTRLAVLFVGGDGCWETISRSQTLVSRMFRRRQFHPLPGQEVPKMMRQYHPLYAHADSRLLATVDAEFGHGNWRNWVSFTVTAVDLARATARTTLDEELVTASYKALGRA